MVSDGIIKSSLKSRSWIVHGLFIFSSFESSNAAIMPAQRGREVAKTRKRWIKTYQLPIPATSRPRTLINHSLPQPASSSSSSFVVVDDDD